MGALGAPPNRRNRADSVTVQPAELTAVILTRNEERHISRAIRCLESYPGPVEILVVDSNSTDRTLEIAAAEGATVITHEFVSHARQLNWVLENVPISSPWVLRLDADEVLYPETLERLHSAIAMAPQEISGFAFNRRHIFLGHWVKFGGRYPLWLLRVWRAGSAKAEDRWMDEHIVLNSGRSARVRGRFEDRNISSLDELITKHLRYASLEAMDRLFPTSRDVQFDSLDGVMTRMKRWLKNRVYNSMPLGSGPVLLFLWRIGPRLGFLDGPSGFAYHMIQGFWYRTMVELKLNQMRLIVENSRTLESLLQGLADYTGIPSDRLESKITAQKLPSSASKPPPQY
ncbi:glycosyltransferase family 2 protein [Curtobacterium ammoniigenes]|uniref:glycosyltransferase family 2 protein n=1 Tax=Curtobacterium ammoniigenes TaxID=395387 RepID=UPI0009F8B49F